jgi:superfamily I DNA and RNA helicase
LVQEKIEGTFYIGYPVMASAESSTTIDALLVSQKPGLVAFHFVRAGEQYKSTQDKLYYILESNLGRHESLRSGRRLGIAITIISIFPDGEAPSPSDHDYPAATPSTVAEALSYAKEIQDAQMYRNVSSAIQRVMTIKPVKKRQNVSKPNSKGATLRAIEREIANLDRWQKSAAIETPDGPQRIRGLAGSGKTVVLALKAAYLHTQHPDWKIAVVFHTRSLYQQFSDLIERFTLEHMGDKPDLERLRILHSWGSSATEGIYSVACVAANMTPYTYLSAKEKFGTARAFHGVCDELAAAVKGRQFDLFDVVLIDEAQDLPMPFFRIVDAITKSPKRIVWAYDELQNLSNTGMATTQELFGREVQLINSADSPRQDIILPVCYRNTPWALTLAHALGFGLLRKPEKVQHFDDPLLWREIGYVVEKGELKDGVEVVLSRGPSSYPAYFLEHLTPSEAVQSRDFDTKIDQYSWIAEQIAKNLEEDELDPDDILIILLNPVTAQTEYYLLQTYLRSRGILSSLAGVTNNRDQFSQFGFVTVSGIYRAKGNEAPMVYIANADYCVAGHELIRLRNILFTSITRSRGWVRLCGVGPAMQTLQLEIDGVVEKGFKLDFRIPTPGEREKMRTIHRDRTAEEKGQIRKAEKSVTELIDAINNGVVTPEMLSRLQELKDALSRAGGKA